MFINKPYCFANRLYISMNQRLCKMTAMQTGYMFIDEPETL